jgi:hypothetical protein
MASGTEDRLWRASGRLIGVDMTGMQVSLRRSTARKAWTCPEVVGTQVLHPVPSLIPYSL